MCIVKAYIKLKHSMQIFVDNLTCVYEITVRHNMKKLIDYSVITAYEYSYA